MVGQLTEEHHRQRLWLGGRFFFKIKGHCVREFIHTSEESESISLGRALDSH